jgi:uncharacterized RDD family membrane protein YckC/ribosomal protein L40E
MPVKVRCRGCQKLLNAPDKARGKTIACPECGTKLKVPEGDAEAAPAKPAKAAKKPVKKAADDDDFLSGLNVDQLEAEHGEEKVCPYCAADLDPEDPVCRKCGMNTETGQMDTKEAKKRARKGADPALFYKAAWTDGWEFMLQYKTLAVKTGLTWTMFLTIVLTCLFMAKTWVFVESAEPAAAPVHVAEGEAAAGPVSPWRSPGFFFYAGLGTVFFLGIPGWFWSLSLKITDKTMAREEIKVDRLNADMFESIALGFRVIFWPAILMLPLSPLFAFAAFSMGIVALLQGGGTAGAGLVAVILSYFLIPYLFFPQALVHMTVRHKFKAWILWDQIVIFFKNAGATLYWWVIAVIVFLPIIILVILLALYPVRALDWTYAQLDAVAAWIFGFIMDVNEPATRPLFFTILFSAFLPAALAIVAAPIAFLGAFPALFLTRVTGLYGFYNRETLDLVTSVRDNQPAGFWVRFLCHTVDVCIVQAFTLLTFGIPIGLLVSGFPLGRYFGGLTSALVNVGFVAIAGSKNARASMISIGLSVLAGVTFIYGYGEDAPIPVFGMVFAILTYFVPLYNMGMYFAVNEGSTSRSTIGKETFGLIVQTADKQKELTLGQAVGRHFGRILCDALGGLPYLTCVFNPKKQALHDIMVKSEVVFRGDK